MPRANKWKAPDLQSTGILAKAASVNNWDAAEAAQAEEWYDHFLYLRWEDSRPLVVMDRKADLLWHTHYRDFPDDYKSYCNTVIGTLLTHTTTSPPHTPPAGLKSAAQTRYEKHGWWPIPDSSTSCY